MKLQELFNKYSSLPLDKKVEAAKVAYGQLVREMGKLSYKEKEIVSFAVSLVRLAAGADNFASESEFNLFVEASNVKINKFEFFDMVKNADSEDFIAAMDEIVDSLSKEAKDAALGFVALFLASDAKLNAKEEELFKRLEA